MSSFSSMGATGVTFGADVRQLEEGLDRVAGKLEATEEKIAAARQVAQQMGKALDDLGEKAESSTEPLVLWGTKIELTGRRLEMATQQAVLMGRAIENMGPMTERAAALQERAMQRMERVWAREKVAQWQRVDSEQAAARQRELAELRADIEARYAESADRAAQAADRLAGAATILGGAERGEAEMAAASAMAHREMAEAMEGGVPRFAATSAAVRLMEGNMTNMVRAAERFVGSFGMLSNLAMKAFPVIGGLAMLDLLKNMGERAYDAYENFAHLKDSIEAIADAEEHAAEASRRMHDEMEGAVESILSKTRGEGAALRQKLTYESAQPVSLSDFFNGDDWKKQSKDLSDKALGVISDKYGQQIVQQWKSMYQSIAPEDLPRRLAQITAQARELRRAAETPSAFGETVKSAGGLTLPSATPPREFWTLTAAMASQIAQKVQDASDLRGAKLQEIQTDIDASDKQARQRGARSGASDAMQDARERLLEMRNQHVVTAYEEEQFWQSLARKARAGSELYRQAMFEANKAGAQAMEQWQKQHDEFLAESEKAYQLRRTGPVVPDLSGEDRGFTREQGRAAMDYLRSLQEEIGSQRANARAIVETNIQLDVAAGRMSRLQALQAQATLDAENYTDALASIARARQDLASRPGLTDTERAQQMAGLDVDQQRVAARYTIAAMQREAAMKSADALGALRESADRLSQAFTDLPAHVQELFTSAIVGINQSLSEALMAKAPSSQEYRRGIANALAGQIRQTGARGIDSALQMGEGALLKKLGFGSNAKADGSQERPYYVRSADVTSAGAGSKASGMAAGLLSKLGGLFNFGGGGSSAGSVSDWIGDSGYAGDLPGFANGGSIPSNMPAIVGERGPELFVPSSAGHIVPNHAIGGNSVTQHLNIDARGAQDPAATEAAVHRAMQQWAPHLTTMALAAVSDDKRRSPLTRR
jgi:hypothetical protein